MIAHGKLPRIGTLDDFDEFGEGAILFDDYAEMVSACYNSDVSS